MFFYFISHKQIIPIGECGEGEFCFNESHCQFENPEAILAENEGLLWCARSYKHLVEYCPKQCPGGTNEECGELEKLHSSYIIGLLYKYRYISSPDSFVFLRFGRRRQ